MCGLVSGRKHAPKSNGKNTAHKAARERKRGKRQSGSAGVSAPSRAFLHSLHFGGVSLSRRPRAQRVVEWVRGFAAHPFSLSADLFKTSSLHIVKKILLCSVWVAIFL